MALKDLAMSKPKEPTFEAIVACIRDLESTAVGLELLLTAVREGDRKRKILVRIGDLMRDVRVARKRLSPDA